MRSREPTVLFAGPSLAGVPNDRLHGIEQRPPAKRGDVGRLVDEHPRRGTLLLCDGVFQSDPAVGHGELGTALDRGWAVWGVSSIGAVRAFEMRDEGMRGWGEVYRRFERCVDCTDDEVALLHLPMAPYTPLTIPLVELRHALRMRRHALAMTPAARQRVLRSLSSLWFGDRTPARVDAVLRHDGNLNGAAAKALLAWTRRHPLKTLDLARFLAERPWQRPSAAR